MRTRLKICGLTRLEDIRAAVQAGADAIGFVFYPPSPRAVSLDQAKVLASCVPPFVTIVGLFVNAAAHEVEKVLQAVPIQLLQFHGDEDEQYCKSFNRPYIKVARMRPETDLIEYGRLYSSAQGLLLDAYVDAYGGSGQSFDWSLIPKTLSLPIILSGGLHPGNVAEAVRRVRPWGVDVSSGVEAAKGIKDAAKIAAFVAGVRDGET